MAAAPAGRDFDAAVAERQFRHPRAETGAVEQFHTAALQQPGADPRLDPAARAALQHDAVDAGAGQQVGEHQPGGAGADDSDPGALHGRYSPGTVRTVGAASACACAGNHSAASTTVTATAAST